MAVTVVTVNVYGFAWSHVKGMPNAHKPAPQTAVMITIRADRDVRFNMSALRTDLRATLEILRKFAESRPPHYPVILCLVTGRTLPEHCAEMPRLPAPPTGAPLDGHFAEYYAEEIAKNPALHDGAVIFSRYIAASDYHLSGWSYRLLSAHQPTKPETNRGSAYNSAISMSVVEHVDLVALVLESGVEIFVHGQRFDVGPGGAFSSYDK